jgi:hypothetical protein
MRMGAAPEMSTSTNSSRPAATACRTECSRAATGRRNSCCSHTRFGSDAVGDTADGLLTMRTVEGKAHVHIVLPSMPFPEPLSGSGATLVPIEQLSLPRELDDCHGTNRALGARPQIAAQNDVHAIRAWLARFVDTKATFDTYRKQSEWLLPWSTTELRRPLSSLTYEDLLVDRRFVADPQARLRRCNGPIAESTNITSDALPKEANLVPPGTGRWPTTVSVFGRKRLQQS